MGMPVVDAAEAQRIVDDLRRQLAEANERVAKLTALLSQLREWDHLALCGDGPFWIEEIDKVLAETAEGGGDELSHP